MPHTPGFDLRSRIQRGRSRSVEKPQIEIGNVVRVGLYGPQLLVIDVDGENVYCEGFIDPFGASSLVVVG